MGLTLCFWDCMLPVRILSTGIALPSRLVLSSELDLKLGKPDGHVQKKSGVISRRYASENQLQSELAAQAILQALDNNQINSESIDLVICASGVQQQALPSTASAVMKHLDMPGVPAFDINASCLSFLTALHTAAALLHSGSYKRIALVSCDLASRGLDWDHPESSYIFGDGAAAVILSSGFGHSGILSYRMHNYPEGHGHCEIPGGGSRLGAGSGKDCLFHMDGKSVFKLASQTLPKIIEETLAAAKTSLSDIDVVVPHQASHLGMAHMMDRLGLDPLRVVNIYATHGNQVAASIPTALHHAFETGIATTGKRMLILGTAAGFAAGAAVVNL